jgi:hypothetical protein
MSVENVDHNLQFVLIGLCAVFAALTVSLFNVQTYGVILLPSGGT